MTPIRVAVNLTWLDPGRVGGSEEYLTRQLRGLDRSVIEPTLFCSPSFARAHADVTSDHAVEPMPGGRWVKGRAGRLVVEHTWLAARTRGFDLVHHGGGTAPLIGRRPIVLTVHDLQYLVFPDFFSKARRRYLELVVPRSIDRAAVVAVPTETVRQHVLESFAVSEDRVVVVTHGVPDPPALTSEDIARVRQRYGIEGGPFALYPAISHPHKRHGVLIEMLDHLDDTTTLVLIGGTGGAEDRLRHSIRSSRHGHRIIRPGRVTTTERDALLAGADVMLFPSRFEGFGAPLVEAMAAGTPVVCSDAAAVREVVGDAAIVVDGDGEAEA
ncbi:MAG: glycosyltransferase family 4 protein, partial [Ilumatobacter sp.]|nr:glycosyltransferase family 4 protein [Ilumatobacter sp.]